MERKYKGEWREGEEWKEKKIKILDSILKQPAQSSSVHSTNFSEKHSIMPCTYALLGSGNKPTT
jgi:hypothetical protein